MKTENYWANMYPILLDMKDCIQDAEWHAEGDVWTHTLMVRDALHNDEEFKNLPEREQNILDAAVMWHDSCKPRCYSVGDDGHIHHPNHAVHGAKLAYAELYRGGEFNFYDLKDIYYLIRWHGRPAWIEGDGIKMVNEISQTVSCRLLSILTKADMRGRQCAGTAQADAIAGINLFRELATETNCLDQPYEFSSGFARWDYFENRKRDGNFDYQAFDDRKMSVHLLCGFPGSGKSTISKEFTTLPTISLDAIRIEMGLNPGEITGQFIQYSAEKCRELMRKKQTFVFDACNVDRKTREKWIRFFWDYKAATNIRFVYKPYKQLLIDNKSRTVYAPERVIEGMINKFQLPDIFEAPTVEYQGDLEHRNI